MTINIEFSPEEERALLERARMSGRDLSGYVRRILQEHIRPAGQGSDRDEAADEATLILADLMDCEAIASCENEADDSITLEEVFAATSKIEDSMARVVIEEERAERF